MSTPAVPQGSPVPAVSFDAFEPSIKSDPGAAFPVAAVQNSFVLPSTTAVPKTASPSAGPPPAIAAAAPAVPSFSPIFLDTPVAGSPLPTVPPEVDLSTSQKPAVVKAGDDYYYYYYYYDDEPTAREDENYDELEFIDQEAIDDGTAFVIPDAVEA